MLNRDDSSKDRDARNLYRFFFELTMFAFSQADYRPTLLTDCSAVLAMTVESSPAIFSVGMYPGCVGLSFLSPKAKWREQI